MSKTTLKGGALLAPIPPVMVSCSDGERDNIITIAWSGMLATQPPTTYISVRPSRFSYEMIKKSGEFVINLTDRELTKVADYCGIYTGAKVDKFEKCKLTKEKASAVSCPMIAESPLSIECKVREIIPMGTHDVFIADILGVSCNERILDKEGKMHFERANLLAYAHGEYFALGEKLGEFGFSTKKEKKSLAKEQRRSEQGEAEKKKPFYLTAPRGRGNKKKGGRK